MIGLLALYIYMFATAASLPKNAGSVINEVLKSEIPEQILGKSGFVNSGEVKIWYEVREPTDSVKGNVLCFMGIANDALAWPEYFIQPIVAEGYRVILFDSRGTGMSDWVENWDKDNPYSLDDMSNDALAVLDDLNIEKAHLLGVSMGGMVAQHMTINYPERSSSLISMMSSGDIEDKELPGMSYGIMIEFLKLSLKYVIPSEKNICKFHIASRSILMGDTKYELDTRSISEEVIYNVRERKGYNNRVSPQHIAAVSKSGSRYEGLQKMTHAALIIHGKSDPLIPFEHGLKCAEMIPNSESLWIDGMGHDVPQIFTDTILVRIFDHLGK